MMIRRKGVKVLQGASGRAVWERDGDTGSDDSITRLRFPNLEANPDGGGHGSIQLIKRI